MPLTKITFLSLIKKRVRAFRGEHHPLPGPEEYAKARLVAQSDALPDRFSAQAADAGMTIHRSGHSWSEDLESLLEEKGCKNILTDAMELLERTPTWDEWRTRYNWVNWATCENPGEESFRADCGITCVEYAVAETGSLVLTAGDGRSRCTSLAPPLHIAIVKEDQILADLTDLFSLFPEAGAKSLPSQVMLITGPSKTSDIEQTLVMGVHGPLEVHVFLI